VQQFTVGFQHAKPAKCKLLLTRRKERIDIRYELLLVSRQPTLCAFNVVLTIEYVCTLFFSLCVAFLIIRLHANLVFITLLRTRP